MHSGDGAVMSILAAIAVGNAKRRATGSAALQCGPDYPQHTTSRSVARALIVAPATPLASVGLRRLKDCHPWPAFRLSGRNDGSPLAGAMTKAVARLRRTGVRRSLWSRLCSE